MDKSEIEAQLFKSNTLSSIGRVGFSNPRGWQLENTNHL